MKNKRLRMNKKNPKNLETILYSETKGFESKRGKNGLQHDRGFGSKNYCSNPNCPEDYSRLLIGSERHFRC